MVACASAISRVALGMPGLGREGRTHDLGRSMRCDCADLGTGSYRGDLPLCPGRDCCTTRNNIPASTCLQFLCEFQSITKPRFSPSAGTNPIKKHCEPGTRSLQTRFLVRLVLHTGCLRRLCPILRFIIYFNKTITISLNHPASRR